MLHARFAQNRLTWRDAWVPFAIFALANLSILLVPSAGLQLLRAA